MGTVLITAGTFIICSIVVLIAKDIRGTHLHRCEECGTIWQHGGLAGFIPGTHECPNCGVEEYWHYNPR